MTRKDYVVIAKAIADGRFINCATQAELSMNTQTRSKIAQHLAESLARDNPRFNRARFLTAAGIL